MITIAVIIGLFGFVLFAAAFFIIFGGIGGLAIVADIAIAIMAICVFIKIIADR